MTTMSHRLWLGPLRLLLPRGSEEPQVMTVSSIEYRFVVILELLLIQSQEIKIIESPWHLTWIRDLPDSSNKGAVTVQDILGDPLISECWNFNFLHDLDFLMRAFDPDTRHLVKLHVIHGFWKREDSNRLMLEVGFDHATTHEVITHNGH